MAKPRKPRESSRSKREQAAFSEAHEDIQRAYTKLTEVVVGDPVNAEQAVIQHLVYCFDRYAARILDSWISGNGEFHNFAIAIGRERDSLTSSAPRTMNRLLEKPNNVALTRKLEILLDGRIAHYYAEFNRLTRAASNPSNRRSRKNSSRSVGVTEPSEFPKRAEWLKARLKERGWSASDPRGHEGPDKNTIHKILRGEKVTQHSLWKLAIALSSQGPTRVDESDIPRL